MNIAAHFSDCRSWRLGAYSVRCLNQWINSLSLNSRLAVSIKSAAISLSRAFNFLPF
jgi:hypothetical protein